jgi:hypothetical protein
MGVGRLVVMSVLIGALLVVGIVRTARNAPPAAAATAARTTTEDVDG